MKTKTHSGVKKRIKVKKSGTLSVQKSCKNHLLSNKSKGQKGSCKSGMAVNKTRIKSVRKLLGSAGKIT